VVGRNARRGARLGTKKEAVEDLGMLEQVDEGTWESQDDVECEKAKQNDIDMKYEGGGIGWLMRVGHGGRKDVLLSPRKARRWETEKMFWRDTKERCVGKKMAVKESKNQVGARSRKKKFVRTIAR
jgi:hypothetical protein